MNKASFLSLGAVLFAFLFTVNFSCTAQEASGQGELPPHRQFLLELIKASQQEDVLSNSLIYSWESDGTGKYELGIVLNKSEQAKQLARYEEILGQQDPNTQAKTVINKEAILVVDIDAIYSDALKKIQDILNDPGTHLEAIRLGYNFELTQIIDDETFEGARDLLAEGLLNFQGRIRWLEQNEAIEPLIQSLAENILEGSESARQTFSLEAKPKFSVPTGSVHFQEYWNLLETKLMQHRALNNLMYEVFPVRNHGGDELKYEIYAYYDAQHEGHQKETFSKVLSSVESSVPVELVRELTLPYSELLQRINVAIEGSQALNGCLIRGVRFESQGYPSMGDEGQQLDYTIAINLSGYCLSDEQHDLLNELSRKVFGLNDAWRAFLGDYTYESVPWFRTRAETIAIVPRHSSSDQIRAFVEGFYPLRDGIRKLSHATQYDECDMPELAAAARKDAAELLERAEKGFIESMAVSPTKLEYRYMRVLSLLANGKDERALLHMRQIVNRNESLNNYSDSCVALELFQGPLRLELIELETTVRTTTKYTHIGLPIN